MESLKTITRFDDTTHIGETRHGSRMLVSGDELAPFRCLMSIPNTMPARWRSCDFGTPILNEWTYSELRDAFERLPASGQTLMEYKCGQS
jgi:hypothetical protein